MNYLNAFADFVAMPDRNKTTWKAAVLRMLAFLSITVLVLTVGDWLDLKMTTGWIFGYAWGALTVYGSMRPQTKNPASG